MIYCKQEQLSVFLYQTQQAAFLIVAILFMARNDFEDAIEYFEEYTSFAIPQEEKDSVSKLIERIKIKYGLV